MRWIVADNVEVAALGRSCRDVGRLSGTAKGILHIRMNLWAARAQPISEIALWILIESDDVVDAAID